MKNSTNNNGFEYSMDDLSQIGVDIAGNGKVRRKTTRRHDKYKPNWNSILKNPTQEMMERKNRKKCGGGGVLADVHDVVREGTLELLDQAISKAKKDKTLNKLDETGLSNLHHAVRYNRVEAVEPLLKYGAQVNILTRDEDNTPLHISSRYGWLESTKLLLEHGANPNLKNINGSAPLHLACRRGNKSVVALLLDAVRAEVNIQDTSLMVPLHVAAIQGDAELCNMLMDKGADYEAQAADKMTPLLAAVANGNRGAADAILGKVLAVSGDISSITRARDIDSNTILHLAALTNNLEIAEKIVKYEQNVNLPTTCFVTPLHLATVKGHLDMVKLLVANGADIHAKSFDGRTSLHKAVTFGCKDIINFLLDNGAVVDVRDFANKTPFLVAVESGQTDSALLLLSKGAKINAYDSMVKNCLHLTIENDQLDTLKALLDIESCVENMHSLDIQERVPLHYAAMCSNIKVLEAILTKQTRFAFQDENQQTPMYLAAEAGRAAHVEALGRAGSPINDRDDEGKSPLHIAAAKGHKKACLELLKLGADINYRDSGRSTPLMFAAKSGAMKTCEILLDNGAHIDDVNTAGDTALLEATRYNHVKIVDMLLDCGASVLIRNNEHMGVIDVAVRWGASDVAMAFCKHPRWNEVLDDKSGSFGHSPMKHLIAHFPDAAKVIMDMCINPVEQTSSNHPDYAVNYDFSFLDPGPDDPASLKGNRYFGPQTMVEYHQSDLLLHPLTQMLLTKKWSSLGKFVYYLNFTTYLVYLVAYTVFLIEERNVAKFVKVSELSEVSSIYNKAGLSKVLPTFIMVFAVFQMLKELLQILLQRRIYFTQPSNILEWALYATTVIFLVPYVGATQWVNEYYGKLNDPYIMWIIAVVSIFLCYVNIILYLRRFTTLGLYITMHMQVVKTLMKVMSVFVIFILSFAVVFNILFREQDAFSDLGRSFVKVTIMMIGEIEYVTTFIDTIISSNSTASHTVANPLNPFPEAAFVFIFIFVFIMGIALMNLLVGLAVGDIDKVQRQATLKTQAAQVEFVTQIEDKYPRIITRLAYKKSIIIWPNRLGWLSRFLGYFDRGGSTDLDIARQAEQENTYKVLTTQLCKTRKRVKTIILTLEAQNRLLKSLVKKIDPDLLQESELDGEPWISPETIQEDFAIPEFKEEEEEDKQESEPVSVAL